MGVCDSENTEYSETKKKRGRSRAGTKKAAAEIQEADPNSSRRIDTEEEIDKREQILRRGLKKEIKRMIDDYDEGIDDYSFGQNKTLLLEAVMVCPNPEVVHMIMAKEADIDKEEYQTGNTAIFLSALDLKVDFVKELLKYKPDLNHRNHSKQNIFEFLKFNLFDQRQSLGRVMTADEKEKYEEIIGLLKENLRE